MTSGLVNISANAHFALNAFAVKNKNAVFVFDGGEAVQNFAVSAKSLAPIIPNLPAQKLNCISITADNLTAALFELSKSLKAGGPVIAGIDGEILKKPICSIEEFENRILHLERGKEYKRKDILDTLHNFGYSRTDFAEYAGEYSVRGSVLDIFPSGADKPARFYFSLDAISSIAVFDPQTQTTSAGADFLDIIPVSVPEGEKTIKNYLPGFMWVYDGRKHLGDETEKSENVLVLEPLGGNDYRTVSNVSFTLGAGILEKEIMRLNSEGYKAFIFCLNTGEEERIREIYENTRVISLANFVIAPLTTGFYHGKTKTAVITSSEVFGRKNFFSAPLPKYEKDSFRKTKFKEFNVGDFVVHKDYGIAVYKGLKTFVSDEDSVECIELEYRLNHKLFVPLYDFKKVHRFIGAKNRSPRVSSLGKLSWENVKRRAGEDARKAALEILKMTAQRAASPATALLGDGHIEKEFADSFPYDETPDQSRAIADALSDISFLTPCDRIVAGDVGFGKTEVAMRAALRAALSGKQTALLAPTTVLTAQHTRNFTQRLAGFPVKIAMLSRFQTPAQQKKILADVKAGIYDIVIGTHRLLSKDVGFARLGLVIIDEEHRFGVKQKEKIKALARGVHCLTLCATPIPRTLYQAMSSLRKISLIETAPEGRMPVQTDICPFNEEKMLNAVRAEIARKGQVFYVHNKVQTLPSRLAYLKEKLPELRICMGHGQMCEKELEKTMWDFYKGKYDVLLASTIIESGLDIPTVNTLIVEDAHEFGLAQLYQLRGRIGRARTKAFCYLFFPQYLKKKEEFDDDKKFPLTDKAEQRLQALMEFSDLGSGFRLALRDLEIRGAGELIGVKQHGFISEAGLSLYCELLEEEIRKIKGIKPPAEQILADMEIKISACIPSDYLPDENKRLEYYKKLLTPDDKQRNAAIKELENLCGPAPAEVKNISRIMQVRKLAGLAGIRRIQQNAVGIEIFFAKSKEPRHGALDRIMSAFSPKIYFAKSDLGDGIRIEDDIGEPLNFIRDFISII